MVKPRVPRQEAQSPRAGLWSTVLGGRVPRGRLVEPRVQERPRSASVERRPVARHGPPRWAAPERPRANHLRRSPTTDQGRRSVGPSVTAGARACWSTRAGGHTALLVLQLQPRAQRPGTDTPAPPARSRKHRRPAGSPARATWPNRVPRGSGRDERYTNGRQVAPDNRRQRQRDGAGCRISGRPGRPAARPERRSRPGTPRPPRSSRPPRRDRGSGRGTGKEDLGLSGHGGRVTGT